MAAYMDKDPEFGTDRTFTGLMDFGGRISSFTCSTQTAPYQRVNIIGSTGRIEIMIPFNAPPDQPCEIILQQGKESRSIAFESCDQYILQGDAFAKAILDDTPPPTTLMDAFENMHTLDALVASAESGSWKGC